MMTDQEHGPREGAGDRPAPEAPVAAPPEETAPTPEEQIAALRDQLLRKAADFENFKRRIERERADLAAFAGERVLRDILPVVDDLERTLAAAGEARASDPFVQGVALILQNLLATLARLGVTPIASVGQPFDVDLHEALLQVERADVPPHTVVEEVQRGYRLHEKVLRHAKVVVSTAGE